MHNVIEYYIESGTYAVSHFLISRHKEDMMRVTPERAENEFRTDRQHEEEYLQMTLEVITGNTAGYEAEIGKLRKDIVQMTQQYREGDTEIWVPLNNTIALYEHAYEAYGRSERSKSKPYFGRIIFTDKDDDGRTRRESLYIGRTGVNKTATEQPVIDWRAPISNVYYENGLGECSYTAPGGRKVVLDLSLKRTFDIEGGKLNGFFDSTTAANDELLNKYLAKNKQAVLGEIVATIQKEQNDIIRRSPFKNVIVQGAAGSGKTTVAMHRISYILYNFPEDIRPADFYIIGSNEMLLNYITGVLPELDVQGFRQMTMEQLFVRLLYEDWNNYKYGIRSVDPQDASCIIRGSAEWYGRLKSYLEQYELSYFLNVAGAQTHDPALIPDRSEADGCLYRDIILNPLCFVEGLENGVAGVYDRSRDPDGSLRKRPNDPDRVPVCLMKGAYIERFLKENPRMSLQTKILTLNERLEDNVEQELLLKDIKYTAKEKKAVRKAFKEYFGPSGSKEDIYGIYAGFLEHEHKVNGVCAGFGVKMKAWETLPDRARAKEAGRNAGDEFRNDINVGHGFFSSEDMAGSLSLKQAEAEKAKNRTVTGLDVYELAALAYIYKQIRETEVISEAHHIVIDEAQDYGMMAYSVLNRCIRECTYTVMGDIAQNIRYDSGLNDWSELRELLLTDRHDAFCMLRKSYRNTIEISQAATCILDHGSFEVYPAEPIIRHGEEPFVRGIAPGQIADEIADICRKWRDDGHGTIAVVCRTRQQADELRKVLAARTELFASEASSEADDKSRRKLRLLETSPDKAEFGNGVMVLSVEMTKGLEFDCVLIYEPTRENYPTDDRNAKLLYVAVTRALHELGLIYSDVRTAGSAAERTIKLSQVSGTGNHNLTGLIADPVPEGRGRRVVAENAVPDSIEDELPQDTSYDPDAEAEYVKAKIMRAATDRMSSLTPGRSTSNGAGSVSDKTAGPERKTQKVVPEAGRTTAQTGSGMMAGGGFASPISEADMTPSGHGAGSHLIKWVSKQADGIYFQSRYGILRVRPISAGIARISFCKGLKFELKEEHRAKQFGLLKGYTFREKGSIVEIGCGRLTVCVDKGNGVITYKNDKGREYLKESFREPRFIDDALGRSYTYFNVNSNEAFYAYPGSDAGSSDKAGIGLKYIHNAAFDVTPDNGDLPLLISRDRYGLLADAAGRTVFCNLPGSGTFTMSDGLETDFYFIAADSDAEIIRMSAKLQGK